MYPVTLNLNGRRCLVVGGGAVALRKVEGLLDEGAKVSVVAPRTLDSEAWTKPFFVRGRSWAARNKPEGFRVYLCEDRMEVACAWLQ